MSSNLVVKDGAPIGVFDSGLGGLTVLMALVRRLPDQPFIYLGDNANAPIGGRSAEEIYIITRNACQKLFDQGCKLVILACNTASAVALRRLQEEWVPEDRRVLGVFVPTIEVLSGRKWGDNSPPKEIELNHVALFATPATVNSGAFQRELGFRASNAVVSSRACTGLVDALENGDRDLAEEIAQKHVEKLLETGVKPKAAVLGCTHYPIVEQAFARALPQGVKIYSQPDITAESLVDYLGRRPEFAGFGGGVNYLTSGTPEFVRRGGRVFLGVDLNFQHV